MIVWMRATQVAKAPTTLLSTDSWTANAARIHRYGRIRDVDRPPARVPAGPQPGDEVVVDVGWRESARIRQPYSRTSAMLHQLPAVPVEVIRRYRAGVGRTSTSVSCPAPVPVATTAQVLPSRLAVSRHSRA
jgi:hypothetical protein